MLSKFQILSDGLTDIIDDLRTQVGSIFANFSINTISILISVLFLVLTIITFIVVMLSVETKSMRTFTNIEKYLNRHPEITKDNIVEFNKLMKARSVPSSIRVQWQNYVVNRGKQPSDFLSEERIVDKPLKSSKYKTTVKFYNFASLLIAGIGFLLGLFFYWDVNLSGISAGVLDVLFLSSLTPVALLILTVVVNAIVSYRYNTIVTTLYENVEPLGKMLDAACKDMPEFVDYEILFTPKEIRKGIPVLQEFLRQRSLKEQEEIEKAKKSEVESENYNFEDLGVDGSLVMDKAMKESEHYLSNRRRYQAEIEQIESEKDLLTRNFDDKSKISQRKLRDIKDNQQRLKEKLDVTTNKIMANELRKQQADEVKKQQAIEKEIDEDNDKYIQELKKLEEEVAKRREEIEKARRYVENVLKNEFKSYSDKIYNTLSDEVGENLSIQMVKFNKEKAELEQKINENNNFVNERDALYQDKLNQIEQLSQLILAKDEEIRSLNENITNAQQAINVKHKDRKDLIDALNVRNQQCQELTTAVSERDNVIKKQEEIIREMTFNLEQEKQKFAELKSEKETEIHHYYDALGREFFYDINDRPYFYDETGKVVYYDEANLEHLIKLDKKVQEIKMHEMVTNEQPSKEKQEEVLIASDNFFDDVPQTPIEEVKEENIPETPVETEEKPADEEIKLPEVEPAAKEEIVEEIKEEPIKEESAPKAEKKEPTMSLSQKRALKLQKMKEAQNAQKPSSKASEKPKMQEANEEPKPQEKLKEPKKEPEMSLAQKRALKLQKATQKNSDSKPQVKKQEKPNTPEMPKEEVKAEPKKETAKTPAKKSGKKEFLSDAEVFEQAFKDLDMAAFNAKLSNVFEQIDAQSKSNKKKK